MRERMLIIGVGCLLDLLFGDPHFLWHPVQGIGWLIEKTEKMLRKIFSISPEPEADKGKKRVAGAILVLVVLFLTLGIVWGLLKLAGLVHPGLKIALSCVLCYQMLAMKSLKTESMKVYEGLREGDVEKARKAVSMIVGRDTENLTVEGVTKAAVETVAENTNDGVIAPLIYMLIGGPILGFVYKAVNTMDSMLGYKNEKYLYFGRVAAKMDDVAGFIPARISALLMILASCLLGMDGKNALWIWKRDQRKHASPNAAQTEAVCAGALQVQLAGDAWYFGVKHEKETIGDPIRKIEPKDILRSEKLMIGTEVLTFLLFGGIRLFF